MKTNHKFNISSLQTVEAKARKAAAVAAVARKNEKGNSDSADNRGRVKTVASPKKRKTAGGSLIDREIRSIFLALSSGSGDELTVVQQQPAKGTYCKGIISVYRKADIIRQKEEAEADNALPGNGEEKRDDCKPFKTRASVMYAFYPSTLDPTRLGSIAIYGKEAEALLIMIRKSGTLFGHRVIDARLEAGIRPFVDVKLRS